MADHPDARPSRLDERLRRAIDREAKIPHALDALGPVAGREVLLLDDATGLLADRLIVMTNIPTRVRATIEVDMPRPRRLANIFDNDHAMAMVAIAASAKLIESAIGLCAPALVAWLLADIVLGMASRNEIELGGPTAEAA